MPRYMPIVVLTLFMSLSPRRVFAQNPKADSTLNMKKGRSPCIVKIDLFMPVVFLQVHQYIVAVTAERPIAKRHSLQLTMMNGWSTYSGTNWEEKEHFIMLIPEYKFFVSKKKQCSGYYVGASAMYLHEKTWYPKYPGVYDDYYNAGGLGLINGLQLYFFKHLTVDLMAGAIFYKDLDRDYGWELFPRVAVNIGYKF